MATQDEILKALENSISEFGRLGPSGAPRHMMIPDVADALTALKIAYYAQKDYIARKEASFAEFTERCTFK